MRVRGITALVVSIALLIAACSGSSSPSASSSSGFDGAIGGAAADTGPLAWPAPPPDRVTQLTANAGLQMETHESLQFHVHAHLDIFVNGEHRNVPAGLGIVITDERVHTGTLDGGPTYGGISVACLQPCISPLHTHDVTGVIHTESARAEANTFGQLFVEWDVRLDDQCVGEFCAPDTRIALFVNGAEKPLSSAKGLALTDREEIAIVIGTRPARIPSEGDFTKA